MTELTCPNESCPAHDDPVVFASKPDAPVICGACGEGVLHMPKEKK